MKNERNGKGHIKQERQSIGKDTIAEEARGDLERNAQKRHAEPPGLLQAVCPYSIVEMMGGTIRDSQTTAHQSVCLPTERKIQIAGIPRSNRGNEPGEQVEAKSGR